jgi:quercetin dioxygenase-like cupin family protein
MRYTENPITRERFAFESTTEDTVRLDWYLPPGGSSPEHVHPRQVERVSGLAGELEIAIRGGELLHVKRGDVVEIPAGTAHRFRNTTRAEAHMTVEFLPALEMREFFEMVAGLANEGKLDRTGRPKNPLRLPAFILRFRPVFHVTRPPLWPQRITLAPLALLARLIGITGYDPKYRLPINPALRREYSEPHGLTSTAS